MRRSKLMKLLQQSFTQVSASRRTGTVSQAAVARAFGHVSSSSPAASLFAAARLPQPLASRAVHVARAAAAETAETFQYQAEVDRLMDLIVNSLYSNKDVFLRELVSNASDALDKARFLSISRPDILTKQPGLEIRIKADEEKGLLIIEDDGIGMTRDDLISSLGTIARSGTAKFMQALKEKNQAGDANLIGQFGVGFYSAFLVANKVKVQTRHPDSDAQWAWESEAGSHQYKIQEEKDGDIVRGTRITLTLKDDSKELLDPQNVSRLIKTYSEFIAFPINLWSWEEKDAQVLDEEATQKAQEKEDAKAKEENREAKKVDPIMKTVFNKEWSFRPQNDNKPLWVKTPKEVSKEEYDEFFKTTFREFLPPLANAHFNVEGTIEFKGLLYIPGMAPMDNSDPSRRSRNIRLYVKRVFISDQFDEDLMPRYLSFIKGVVDSADLPLNVSREILQESRIVRTIRKQLITRSINMVKTLQEDKEKYRTFWEAFGRQIKLGVIEDQGNRNDLAKLLQFSSSHTQAEHKAALEKNTEGAIPEEDMTSLDGYVSRMKEGQAGLYYLVADSPQAASAAPFVEKLVKKGFEVLFLTDPIDEYVMMNLGSFKSGDKELKLLDVTRENLDLGDKEEQEKLDKAAKDLQPLTDFMTSVLKGSVEKVVVSSRLESSPCILVTSQFGFSANMERIMKANAMSDKKSIEYMRGRKTLEINPGSPVIQSLRDELARDKDSAKAKDLVKFMYQTALLTSGFELESPQDFASKIYGMMAENLGGASSAPSTSSSSASTASTVVEPTVVSSDGSNDSDPWGKKN